MTNTHISNPGTPYVNILYSTFIKPWTFVLLCDSECWTYIAEWKPKDGWPSQGVITFDQVFLTYSKDEPPVLKNVSFTLKPAEKVTFLFNMMWVFNKENYKENQSLQHIVIMRSVQICINLAGWMKNKIPQVRICLHLLTDGHSDIYI